ncbi:hypothetical protein [Aurantiacibacter spongiae]|nr:hypothetical protein [Aurantiacibacter spongiae]
MIALTGSGLCLLMALLFYRETDLGRAWHEQAVERPARRLAAMERHHLLFAVALAVLFAAGGEIVLLMGPEFMAAYALDLAIYADALLISYAAAVATRLRGVVSALRYARPAAMRRRSARARRARIAAVRRGRRPANDDDGPAPGKRPGLTLAA